MDRRAFLYLLGKVGVLAGGSGWLLDAAKQHRYALAGNEPVDVSEWLAPDDLAVHGRSQTFDICASNESSGLACVVLRRFPQEGGEVLLNLWMGPEGVARWIAVPGSEILGPVRIIVPPSVNAIVTGTDAWGRIVAATRAGTILLSPA